MKCPNCKTEMVDGRLGSPGQLDLLWRSDSVFKINGSTVIAHKCPKCGKIELSTEV